MSDTIYPGDEADDLRVLADLQNNREIDPEYWVRSMSRRIIDLNFRITKLENMLQRRVDNTLDQFESRMVANQNTMYEWMKKELEEKEKERTKKVGI